MKAYYYLFYKIYKFWEKASVPKFWSDAKAVLTIAVLEEFTALSLIVYYKVLFNNSSQLLSKKWIYILIGIFCFFSSCASFYHHDYWKHIVSHYDKWTERKNNKGSISVALFVLVVILNFVFACWLFKNYK